MSLVKCKCGCGQSIDSSIAYHIKVDSGTVFRFLSEEHYLLWKERAAAKKKMKYPEKFAEIYTIFLDIFKRETHSGVILAQEIEEWEKLVPSDVVVAYLTDTAPRLQKILIDKQFIGVVPAIRYLSTIIKKELPSYRMETMNEVGKNQQVVEEKQTAGLAKKKRKSLSDLEGLV